MDNTNPKSHVKIIKDAQEFILENKDEFVDLCNQIGETVSGRNLSMGVLCLQTVLGSLIASDEKDKEDIFYRVMVLTYAQISHPDNNNFNLVDKGMLN